MDTTNGHVPPSRVLCPEKLSPDGLSLLRKTLQVDEKQGLTPDQLISIIPEYDALLVRSETKVTADVLNAGRRLKVVARAGVGVDNVDVPAATRLGIVVVNSPSGNIQAAAEHTIALLMSMARNVPDACASLKGGKWERSRLVGVEVKGKTLGVVGLGKGMFVFSLRKWSCFLIRSSSWPDRLPNGSWSRDERGCRRPLCLAVCRRRCQC